jgi:hypothetical protein
MTAEVIDWPFHSFPRAMVRGERFCLVCNGLEASLTTHCPKRRLHHIERLAIMNGHIDFRSGQWIPVSDEARRPVT